MFKKTIVTVGIILISFLFQSHIMAENETNLEQLLAKIELVRKEHNVPAVGLTIVKQGEVEWQGSLGVADLDNQKVADENTFYRVGSITKAFTSIALLKLQGE